MSEYQPNNSKELFFKKAGIFLAGLLTATAVNFAKPVIESKVTEFQQNQKLEEEIQIQRQNFENFKESYPKLISLIEENNCTVMIRKGNIQIFCIKKGETPGLTIEIIEELKKNNIGVQELSSGQLHYDTFPARATDTFTKVYKLNLNNAKKNNFRGNNREDGRGFFDDRTDEQRKRPVL